MIEPLNDRVLVQRIEKQRLIQLTDADKGIEGVVLAAGPGKWLDGERQKLEVKAGDKVLFNSRWNDFTSNDHKHELPLGHDQKLHLIQEQDIFAKIS